MFKEQYVCNTECTTHRQPTGAELVLLRSTCSCSMKAGYYKQVAVLRQDGTNAATVLLGRLAVMSHNGRFFFFLQFC